MTLFRRALPLAALTLAGFAGAASAQSTDPSFRANNGTRITINELYVSSANDSGWGADRLGSGVLPPGGTYTVRLPNGQCVNDIKVVFEGGRAQEWRQQNTCQFTDFNIQ